ncbi:gamma-aminobutyric acid receptor subunit pi [Pimephales promelas]|nr:gamma-aminobutyric acid receptor subunit pi [Pimephales promelas]
MKGYNKYLRPFFDNGPVTVGMSLDIASIDTISEINMDYTATIFLRQRWTDERLVFEGNKSLSLDGRLVELLWVPDTFIVDSKKSFLHDITVENRLIRIFPNGTVLYALRITTTVACNMDLTKYPMDKQTCTLQLESWGYNVNDVMFNWARGNESVSGLDTLRLAQYTVEDHYTSASEAVYETGNYPRLIFHFELKRSILYFILETYVPSSLLVVLSWVSFWISQSSVPARICIGVTTVLTMTTLMMGARTSLPNANCFIKAIDVYLGICFSFIFGALIEYARTHGERRAEDSSSSSSSSSHSSSSVVFSVRSRHRNGRDDEELSELEGRAASCLKYERLRVERDSKFQKIVLILLGSFISTASHLSGFQRMKTSSNAPETRQRFPLAPPIHRPIRSPPGKRHGSMLNIHDNAFSAERRAAGRRNATRIATSFFIH